MKRFWAKVDVRDRDDCWVWLATKVPGGYGMFFFNGRAQPAHRIAFLLEIGEIPEGHDVHHLCATRLCCNPSHLATMLGAEHKRWHQLNGSNHNANKTECGVCGGELLPRADGKGRWCQTCQRRRERAYRERVGAGRSA